MSRARVLLCVAGTVLIGYGAVGLLTADRGPEALRYLAFLAAGVVGHDLLVAPAALAVGGLAGRLAPAGTRGLVLGGLFASLAVTLIALPFILGYGYRPDVPSALPLDYGRGLALTLGGVWVGVAVVGLLRWTARLWTMRRRLTAGARSGGRARRYRSRPGAGPRRADRRW